MRVAVVRQLGIAVVARTGLIISLPDATQAWDCLAAAHAIGVRPLRISATNMVEITARLTVCAQVAMYAVAHPFSLMSMAMVLR